MPCTEHAPKSQSGCIICFTADVLDLLVGVRAKKLEWSQINVLRSTLAEAYQGLDESQVQGENYQSFLRELNAELIEQGLALIGAEVIQGYQIEDTHRDCFRRRLARNGTWIGATELHCLGELFSIQFSIAFPSGGHWRCITVGPQYPSLCLASPVLRWNGAHYDVVMLAPAAGLYDVIEQSVIPTNPRGDCAFESFLILLMRLTGYALSPHGRIMGGPQANRKKAIIDSFRAAYRRRSPGECILHTDPDYISAITGLRALLATPAVLSDELVDKAIVAEGALPEDEVEPKKEEPGELSGEKPPEKTSAKKPSNEVKALFDTISARLDRELTDHATKNSSASNVIGYLQGEKVDPGSLDSRDFALSKCPCENKIKGECEHTVSKGDAEVLLLNAILQRALTRSDRNTTVFLCGPYGPCHGCKDRIAKFVTLWQQGSPRDRTLVVHYVYAAVFDQTRGTAKAKFKTVYGDHRDPFMKVEGTKDVLYVHTWGPESGKKG